MSTKKMVLAAMFLAIGLYLPFLTGQSRDGQHAPADAPACLDLRICLWMAIRFGGRFHFTPLAEYDLYHAAFPHSRCTHGL